MIANRGTPQLRCYDPEGTHLIDAGGEGEGPGEFEAIAGFTRLPGDGVGVMAYPPFFLLEIGDDHVLGVHKDEFERESVRLHRLIR